MNHRYFFSARFKANGDKSHIHGIINTPIKVKSIRDLNFIESQISIEYDLTDENRKTFIFVAFNKI